MLEVSKWIVSPDAQLVTPVPPAQLSTAQHGNGKLAVQESGRTGHLLTARGLVGYLQSIIVL